MKFTKFDIGAEIISIITRGMYQDPRDAIREYIQNGIDAGSKNIDVKIRQNSVVISDDGAGMDYATLRKAIRVGISEKDPNKKVGFMGIGIYSSFHICDKLIIHTHKKGLSPNRLEMNFLTMRNALAEQKQLRLDRNINDGELLDLQTLMETHIDIPHENTLTNEDFPSIGTRVELIGLEPAFLNAISSFDDIANYLRDVIPLHFDKEKFMWAQEIESKINEICEKYNTILESINLELQVNNRTEKLYRPYRDSDFTNNTPLPPDFLEIKRKNEFLGVVWGCLNSERHKILNKSLRGFLIKKQGFAIGDRNKIARYFRQRTHFDRYTGEIVLTSPLLLPNAARNDLEFSEYTTIFTQLLAFEIAPHYIQISTQFQARHIADEKISEVKTFIKELNAKYKRDEKDSTVLVNYIVELNANLAKIRNKDSDSYATINQKETVARLKENIDNLISDINISISNLVQSKKPIKTSMPKAKKQMELSKDIESIKAVDTYPVGYDNFVELLIDLDIEMTPEIKLILEIIDERFIQALSTNRTEYYNILNDLRDTIIDNL